jgi:hypothetical protein
MRKRIYLEATAVLRNTAGAAVLELVSSVVIHDQQCPFAGLKALNVGLSVLAQHCGLTNQRNSWHQNAWSEL